MSTWGKLAGASAGYFIGGIIGAVVGAVAGHYVIDKEDEDVAFAIALIALSAKMSRADGDFSEKELMAFNEILSEVPKNELNNVIKIYKLAQQDIAGYEAYAEQISKLFEGKFEVLENVLVRDKNIINKLKCKKAIRKANKLMGKNGRLLVRKSGTEPKIRIMGESHNKNLIMKCIRIIKQSIKY